MVEKKPIIKRGSPEWLKLLAEVPGLRTVAILFMTPKEREELVLKMVGKPEQNSNS